MTKLSKAVFVIAFLAMFASCNNTQQTPEADTKSPIKTETNQTPAGGLPVDITTAIPAESELMFNNTIERAGGVNKFDHSRLPATAETQAIVRTQTDMLYSHGVFDASEGLEITVPEAGLAYQSAHVFDANHGQLGVFYPGESTTITADDVSTENKHIYVLLRTSVDQGVEAANKAQDLVKVTAGSAKPYVGPGYDQEQLKFAKQFLAPAANVGLVTPYTAYSKDLIPGTVLVEDATQLQQYHYITSGLLGWALMPNADAFYGVGSTVDGDCVTVNFVAPPIQDNGYWSLTAYGKDGYVHTDNNVIGMTEAVANADGSYTVHIGNTEECQANANHLDMPEGGSSLVLRIYRLTSLEEALDWARDFGANNTAK